MSAVLEAKTGMRNLATKAKEIHEDTALTNAEKKEAMDKLETDLKGFSETITLNEQAQRLMAGGETADDAKTTDAADTRTKSFEEQILESGIVAKAAEVSARGGKFDQTVELKAVATVNEGTGFSNGFPNGMGGVAVTPQYLPGILPLLFRRLVIADLFAQGAATGNAISYVKETQFQNFAAGVAEAGAKPQSDDTIARVQEQVGKIAHYMKTTDELVQDAPAFISFLRNRLVFGVQYKEDAELLNGSGYPSVPGLAGRSGLQTAISGGTTGTLANTYKVIDAIFQQITAIRATAFVEPDAIVMHPTDWQNIRLAKDANSQYYAGGPFTGAYGTGSYTNVDALWGLRVVTTPAQTAGTIMIGGFQQCGQVFRRQGITVEMTNSHVDDFTNNLITMRAEERLALAIYRPAGFGTVTVTWA